MTQAIVLLWLNNVLYYFFHTKANVIVLELLAFMAGIGQVFNKVLF